MEELLSVFGYKDSPRVLPEEAVSDTHQTSSHYQCNHASCYPSSNESDMAASCSIGTARVFHGRGFSRGLCTSGGFCVWKRLSV